MPNPCQSMPNGIKQMKLEKKTPLSIIQKYTWNCMYHQRYRKILRSLAIKSIALYGMKMREMKYLYALSILFRHIGLLEMKETKT